MSSTSTKSVKELTEDQIKAYRLIGYIPVSVQELHDQYKRQLHWSYDLLARHMKFLYDSGLIHRDWEKQTIKSPRRLVYWKKK